METRLENPTDTTRMSREKNATPALLPFTLQPICFVLFLFLFFGGGGVGFPRKQRVSGKEEAVTAARPTEETLSGRGSAKICRDSCTSSRSGRGGRSTRSGWRTSAAGQSCGGCGPELRCHARGSCRGGDGGSPDGGSDAHDLPYFSVADRRC